MPIKVNRYGQPPPRVNDAGGDTSNNGVAPDRGAITSAGAGRADSARDIYLRSVGVDPASKVGPANIGASQIGEILGASRVVELPAVNVPGKVVWVNYDLARALGFDVPASNKMTEAFHQQLTDALSYRLLGEDEDAAGRDTITVAADKYGGTGIGTNRGSGRAAFLPWGNLQTKGIGRTPLADVDPDDFQHSHGGAPMREGFLEAIWGEVNSNLFAQGSTRILAVIDNGDHTEWPDGGRERRALIVRAGNQIRPAHLLKPGWYAGEGGAFSRKVFVDGAERAGCLVTRTDKRGQEVPDLAATMLRLVDNHACTEAEQFRWRILHGAISTSNMELDGAMLDLATESSQPRTAPIKTLAHGGSFGQERLERAEELEMTYKGLVGSLKRDEVKRFNATGIDFRTEINKAYSGHLEVQLLKACGLKEEVAISLKEQQPKLARDFAGLVLKLSRLRNEGNLLADKELVKEAAAVDVFNVLRNLPERYFAAPDADHSADVRELLNPILLGSKRKKEENGARIDDWSSELASLYGQVMEAATGHADEHYGGVQAMQRSVTSRAGFENAPIDKLYRSRLNQSLTEAIAAYEGSGDPAAFTEAADKAIAESLRNVDRLLEQGQARRLDGGLIESGRRAVDGVTYATRGWEGSGKRRLHVSIPLTSDGGDGFNLNTLPGQPHLSRPQAEALRYRFTTDGWKSHGEAPARIEPDERGQLLLSFDIPALASDAGRLEGLFHCTHDGDFWLKDGCSNFRGYTYAVPDQAELSQIAAQV